jgi:hypothetical protein
MAFPIKLDFNQPTASFDMQALENGATSAPTPTPPPPCPAGTNYVASNLSQPIVQGTVDVGNHCDDCTTAITLPFPVTIYDHTFTTARVSSNGNLQFEGSVGTGGNNTLPRPTFGTTIYAFWDDLVTNGTSQGIFTSVSGTAPHRRFNIEWRAAAYNVSGSSINFAIQLREGTSSFKLFYGQATGTFSGTIGVQRDAGSLATQFAGPSATPPALNTGLAFQLSCPNAVVAPTPTATPTATPSSTPTPTPVVLPTATPSPSASATPSASPTPRPPRPRQLLNIATRLRVQTDENVLIGGVIVTGTNPKRVIIRAVGPSLAGVFEGALSDTTLELYQGDTLLAENDNWKDTQQAAVEATTIPPNHELESAIVYTLQPGFYTAVMSGKDRATGIGVIEVYDLDQEASSQLANIASRGFVEAGDSVMIGGLIVGGNGTENARILLRAVGPSLGKAGVDGALQDPTLELRDANGEVLRENDNWQDSQQAEVEATTIPPSDAAESAILASLPAGNYTAIVRGKNDSSGVGVVEVYNVP